jgi:hypothetical protein
MKLLDILNEQRPEYKNEYKVMYTVLKDKDFSKGTATYKDEADARKFFDDITKDDEVISARLRKFTGPDSSQDMMGGAMKSLGRSEDIEKYTHPAWLEARQGGMKYDELTDQEKNIRSFLGSPSFLSKKRGFTNKDGSDKYFEESLEEGMSKSAIMHQIKDAEEILDSGEANGVPLDNETEMLVQQELTKLKRMLAMNETSLEKIYNQVSEAKDFGFFGNEEGKTGNAIASEAFDDYEAAVERAFQNLVNKVNTAINIGGSGGTDTEVREMMMYHFDKIQDQITTTDLINATFRK